MLGRWQKSVCLLRLCGGFSKKFNKNYSSLGVINELENKNKLFLFQKSNFFTNVKCSSADNISEEVEEPDIEAIAGQDPELINKLKIIILETDVMRQEGKSVPEVLKQNHWQELLTLPTRSQRRKYLSYLFKTEKAKENDKIKKQNKKLAWLESKEQIYDDEEDDGHIKYSLKDNSIFIRIYDTTINQLYNNKLVQAMQFGQKLVIDCSYDEYMTNREAKNCGKQLMLVFAENRSHDEPFDLHYCNVNKQNETALALNRHVKTLYEPWFPLHIHEDSYLDHFPKDKLVYLTPHCRDELTEFDHDAVYIIGGMVDKLNNEPLSLAKAKANKLKMAKLPLDTYLQWGAGSGKSLTLNQMISILLDVKKTGDWMTALRHVPRRKLENYYGNSAILKTPSRLSYSGPKRSTIARTPPSKFSSDAPFIDSDQSSQSVSSDFVRNSQPFRGSNARNEQRTYAESGSTLSYKQKEPGFSFANRNRSRESGQKITKPNFVKDIIDK